MDRLQGLKPHPPSPAPAEPAPAPGPSPGGLPRFLQRPQSAPASEESLEREATGVALRMLGGSAPSLPVAAAPPPTGTDPQAAARDVAREVGARTGYDLGGVRFHADERAAGVTRSEGALAMASGPDVYVRPDLFRPDLAAGRALLAHELAHVAQQGAGPRTRPDPVRDELRALSAGAPARMGDYDQAVGALGSELSAGERLRDCHALSEPDAPLTPAPPSMRRQRCSGCSGCQGGSPGPAPSASPSAGSAPTPAAAPPAPTPGQRTRQQVDALLNTAREAKSRLDQLTAGLREIRAGTSLDFLRARGPAIITDIADNVLSMPAADKTARLADWTWFLAHGPPGVAGRASDSAWEARVQSFRGGFVTPLGALKARFPESQAEYYMKNTPSQVFDLVHSVATPRVPPALLYAIASREGMVDQYIRTQHGVPASQNELTPAQLAATRTDQPVNGFNALGLDTFFTELGYADQSLRGFFPTGFTEASLIEVPRVNEKGTEVRSANAPDLRTGLQALVAMVSRRQAVFEADAAALGYAAPTPEQKVYFTYLYYNTGPGDRAHPDAPGNGGYQTLYRHRPGHPAAAERRTLATWITRGEYPNAIVVLRTYQMVAASGILAGF